MRQGLTANTSLLQLRFVIQHALLSKFAAQLHIWLLFLVNPEEIRAGVGACAEASGPITLAAQTKISSDASRCSYPAYAENGLNVTWFTS